MQYYLKKLHRRNKQEIDIHFVFFSLIIWDPVERHGLHKGHYIDCKVQNVPEFYVDCEGFVLPCCYLASPFYRARHNWSNEIYHFHDCWNDLWEGMDVWELNAKHHRLFEDILHKHKWFSNLEIMWKTSSPAVCNKICGNKEINVTKMIQSYICT